MEPTLNTLDDVPEAERACYEPAEAGGFVLKEAARSALAEHGAKVADANARLARAQATFRRLVIERDVRRSLSSAGVNPALMRAATALALEELKYDVRGDQDGDGTIEAASAEAVVVSDYGDVEVGNAIDGWLQSASGEPFRPPAPPTEGRFTAALRGLRH